LRQLFDKVIRFPHPRFGVAWKSIAMVSSKAVCFIVGSYRSGTTFLAEVLGRHPRIAQFHEPYFVWDRYFGPGEDDARIEAQATPRVQRYVTAEFNRFLRKSGAAVLDSIPSMLLSSICR
jgi:hypothetical protein